MSSVDTMPTTLPSRETTGTRCTRSKARSAAACATEAVSGMVKATGIITWSTVRAGAGRSASSARSASARAAGLASSRSVRSRSVLVTTPTGRPAGSTTGAPLMSRRRNRSASASSPSSALTQCTSPVMIAETGVSRASSIGGAATTGRSGVQTSTCLPSSRVAPSTCGQAQQTSASSARS
jgi:hypothetical protein